jgi:ABC-type sugar transport system ATPase subunit
MHVSAHILHLNLDSVCLDMNQQHIYFILGDVVTSEESLPGKLGGIYIRARHVICAEGIDISKQQQEETHDQSISIIIQQPSFLN